MKKKKTKSTQKTHARTTKCKDAHGIYVCRNPHPQGKTRRPDARSPSTGLEIHAQSEPAKLQPGPKQREDHSTEFGRGQSRCPKLELPGGSGPSNHGEWLVISRANGTGWAALRIWPESETREIFGIWCFEKSLVIRSSGLNRNYVSLVGLELISYR